MDKNLLTNSIKKNESLFAQVVQSQVVLDLNGDKINDEKMLVISEALKLNSSLITINLKNNKIGDEGVKYLSESLKINSSLKSVYLSNNKIGDEGVKYLCESLPYNNSITELNLFGNEMSETSYLKVFFVVEQNKNYPEDAKKRVEKILRKSKTIKEMNFSSITLVFIKKKKNSNYKII